MDLPQLFGIVPTGQPVITAPTSAPAQTSFIYTIPPRPFSHIVVFILPGITLPPDSAAAVYLASPSQGADPNSAPNFKFLGGIGPGKESAIFKVSVGNPDTAPNGGNIDMDATEGGHTVGKEMVIGISLEPAANVAALMSALPSRQVQASEGATALVVASRNAHRPDTLVLAQRIIKNAFNFLTSFSGNVPIPGGSGTAGVEVVPLKAFEDWWRKFEARVRNDPAFLEKDAD
jgi:hypothetical protein